MNIVLLGAPGAGKGTQASLIAEKYSLPHISTGDIFRDNIKRQTEIGLLAKSYTDKGQLVPDEVTCEIVRSRLKNEKGGFLLDGFPRNLFQAEKLDSFAKIDAVINIEIDLNKLLKRLTGRRCCSKCGESFHIDFLDGKTDCAKCGGELYQRKDDNEETVKSRLDVYAAQTAPLTEYYKGKGNLINIDGDQKIEKVFEDIVKALKK